MCHSILADRALHQAIPNYCTAKTLGAGERLSLGIEALAGHHSITGLAEEAGVSRKFVYQQADIAQAALDEAFTPADSDDKVLFHLPVTKHWLKQVALSLTLICHSSYRGVHEFCRDLLDVNVSIGAVHNIVHDAIDKARPHNLQQDLANVHVAGFDEIFQNRQPVLVGADIHSTYCFLLSAEEQRDADTWALRMLELKDRGLAPQASVADFGAGIRAGQKRAEWNGLCRGDIFHALNEIVPVVTFLDNRAYDALAAHDKLVRQKEQMRLQARRDQLGKIQALRHKIAVANEEVTRTITLADDVALLTRWLRYDVFAVSALPYDERVALFDFVLAELDARSTQWPRVERADTAVDVEMTFAPTPANLVAQNYKMNRGTFNHTLEKHWDKQLQAGYGIEATVVATFRAGGDRPIAWSANWIEITPQGRRIPRESNVVYMNPHTQKGRDRQGIASRNNDPLDGPPLREMAPFPDLKNMRAGEKP